VLASSAPEMRSKFYQFLAFAEQKSGNFRQAEVLYLKALKENQKTKIASHADTILYIPRSIEIYFDFASLFIQTRATVGDSTGELFEKAMTQYHKAFGLIDLLRENVLSEESMLVINKNYKNLTEQYCTILLDNMKPGSDRKSYENAWQGIQRYKSMAMQISRKESLLKSNITEGSRISAMLRYLQLEKDFYLSEKSGEESMPSPDSSKIAGFEYRITQINRSYHLIKKRLIDDDPARFSRYFEPDFQRLSQLQQSLGDGIGVIDLFVPDSGIFAAFYITADTFWVHHENSGELKSLTDSLAKYVEFADIDHHNELMQSKFEEFSYQLFKLLGLKQFIEKDITRIHVIPSPESAPIPFDILLTEPAEPDQNYSNYPYLIRKAEIVWSYSPVYINESYPAPLSDPNIAAFAPEYQCSTSGNITLGKLRKNTDEVDFACRFFSGNTYTGDAASIANFVRETKTADIIHLAVHSSGSTRSASECGIYFSGDNSGECPFFNRNRISNLNTKARLAVISSCNSGSGIHAEGEGALSLSRSFYISGCSSVIASFWAADDYATSGIIKKFYSHIASGRPVSSALRDAKLEFLEDAGSLRAHPFFWSNLFVLGSADLQITSDNNNDFGYTNLLFPLLSGIGIISFFFFAQRKKISDLR
ncbi:MAG: CHAT domain-containing protein, partial [Bacteroidetes bacterium]|nr:CHAT domain-containing protein [Bacteroidota bacterium]